MKKGVAALGALVVLLYIVAIFFPIEPVERRPGTRLGGEVAPVGSEVETNGQILVETRTWYLVRHSVTTTSWTRDGEIYVPCRACAGKRWPKNVAADPRVRLKIDGKLYDRIAVRVTDESEVRRLFRIEAGEPLPDRWVFRMEKPTG